MNKKNSGGWAQPDIHKIIGLSILNAIGINFLTGSMVLKFNLPQRYRTDLETFAYSIRLMKAMHPECYQTSLAQTQAELLPIAGSEDKIFRAGEFENCILAHKPDARVHLVENGTHFGIVMSEQIMQEVGRWVGIVEGKNDEAK
ncbi:MAG: non-heme chloroperoxidase [Gammaproteobacteria bacterium]|jgi:non-heme chloroperoxidase